MKQIAGKSSRSCLNFNQRELFPLCPLNIRKNPGLPTHVGKRYMRKILSLGYRRPGSEHQAGAEAVDHCFMSEEGSQMHTCACTAQWENYAAGLVASHQHRIIFSNYSIKPDLTFMAEI